MSLPALPAIFCWTRFGTEAGEPIDRILARKDQERRDNAGTFFWGIGNSVAPGLAELLKRCEQPEVLFSAIKSRPRVIDVAPAYVVRWRAGQTLAGERVELPTGICVTSTASSPETCSPHYALVCSTRRSLQVSNHGRLRLGDLRNLGSGNPLGFSQVTAVVSRHATTDTRDSEYLVAMRTDLVEPYFVRLDDPEVVRPAPQRRAEAA